jgi:hypothetical protein
VTPIAGIDLSRCSGNLTDPVRDLEWLAPHAQELNTSYRRKAAKIYTHGTAADLAPCSRCATGKGPFQKCVIAWDDEGYISQGNCANCYWFHKTSSCSRRYTLPCQALADLGEDLGGFEEACRIHCGGAHIPDDSQAVYHHAGESLGEEQEEDDEDEDHRHDHDMSEDEENGSYDVEEEEKDYDDDASEANHDEQPRINKRKTDDDEEYQLSKVKKTRGFTAVNYQRA